MEQFYPTKMFTQVKKAVGITATTLLAGFLPLSLAAQAPSISYAGPQVYQTNNAITPLLPTSNGVAVPGYRRSLIDSGLVAGTFGLAADGSGNLNVAPDDATLSGFVISNGTLNPGFVSGTTNYKTNVGYNLKTMTITPTATNPSASIMVAGQPVASGSASQYLTLQVGQNTVNTVVTSADGTKTKTYVLTVGEARSGNNNLSALKTSAVAISPTFAASNIFYTETVNYSRTSITVTPTTADTAARVTVNGTAVVSGAASAPVPLSVGKNTITVVVTAQNTATNTYTIMVTRSPVDATQLSNLTLSNGALSPAFYGTTYNYTTVVGNGLSGMTVTPTAADPTSTITVNGVVVASGTASQTLPLAGGGNTITIVVTPSGGTGQTYTVLVKKAMSSDANLFSLRTNAGLAVGKTVPTTIIENVSPNIGAIKVTPTADDTTAVIRIDEAVVQSGTESDVKYLSYGNNIIFIQVYPQSGQEKDYTLQVFRASPPPANQPLAVVSGEGPTSVGVQNFEPLLKDDGIKVHPGLSPNGDGIDDFLLIENISQYPENHLSIMNRNGLLVYEVKGYDNGTKVFDGHSNKNGRMQLPGTYFYALDYTVGSIVKHKTGFLVLKY